MGLHGVYDGLDSLFGPHSLGDWRIVQKQKSGQHDPNGWSGCHHYFTCFDQHRDDPRFDACCRSSTSFFQLRRFFNDFDDVWNRAFTKHPDETF